MNKPTVGQILYSVPIRRRQSDPKEEPTPAIVTKVGRKYFTIREGWEATQFHITNWLEKGEYSANERLYESVQAYEDKIESTSILKELRQEFDNYGGKTNISLPALKTIKGIVDEANSNQPKK